MAAPLALPTIAAALIFSSPVLSEPPLVAVEEAIERPRLCKPEEDELRIVRILEGMPPSWQPVADASDTGEQVWASRCASCHAMNGNAQTHMGRMNGARNFTEPAWQECRTDGDIRAAILRGVAGSRMRAFREHLTDAQLEQLVQVVRGFDVRVSRGRPVAFAQ